jgi:hypothetical protein
MTRDLFAQLATLAMSGLIALAFFRAYRDPNRDGLTRLLYRYVQTTGLPVMEPRKGLLVTSVICAAVALMCLLFAIAEVWRIL